MSHDLIFPQSITDNQTTKICEKRILLNSGRLHYILTRECQRILEGKSNSEVMYDKSNSLNMENSLKLESMPTLCRSATLPAETTISKWRVTETIRQLLQLPTGGTSAFGGLKATAPLHSNFQDVPTFRSHQLPL